MKRTLIISVALLGGICMGGNSYAGCPSVEEVQKAAQGVLQNASSKIYDDFNHRAQKWKAGSAVFHADKFMTPVGSLRLEEKDGWCEYFDDSVDKKEPVISLIVE